MTKVALVTGGNQGLGFSLIKSLADKLGAGGVVYLAARSQARGLAAIRSLPRTPARVEYVHLDVTVPDSIWALRAMVQQRHGGIDVVASNAAGRVVKDTPQSVQVRGFVATNNHGSYALYRALEGLLRKHARYVMVASTFGRLSLLPVRLRNLFDTDTLSLEDIETNMAHYVSLAERDQATAHGWPEWINIPSKIGQVATARIAARDIQKSRPDDDIVVMAACPGLIDTEASRPWFDSTDQVISPDEGAVAVIDLLLAPPDGQHLNGQLLQFGQVQPWLDE